MHRCYLCRDATFERLLEESRHQEECIVKSCWRKLYKLGGLGISGARLTLRSSSIMANGTVIAFPAKFRTYSSPSTTRAKIMAAIRPALPRLPTAPLVACEVTHSPSYLCSEYLLCHHPRCSSRRTCGRGEGPASRA